MTQTLHEPDLRTEPQVHLNLVDGLAAEVRRQHGINSDGSICGDLEEWVEAEHAAEAWLRQHGPEVAAWSLEVYGAHMDAETDPRARRFHTHDRPRADALHEALRTGDFFRRMLDEAPRRD